MNNKKPMPNSTQTEVKISTPIAHKISLGIMMTAAFIALFALIFGLYSETYQKPSKEAIGTICADGRIATKCSCGMVARTPSSNYCCSNIYQTTPCNQLKLWLPFDNNLLDNSGNNNHAKCSNPYCPVYAVGHTETPLSATGYLGSQYLTVTNPAALNISGAVTMALWINPASSSRATWQRVIASPLSFTDPYVLSYIAEDNSIAINRRVGSNVLTGMKAVGAVEEGKWQHVAAGYDASNNPFIYINGVNQKDLVDAGRSADIIPGDFRIGSRQDGSVSFIGLMDNLRIYSKALSQAEINQLAGVLCLPTDPPTEICSDGIDQDCNGTDLTCDSCANNNPITTRCLCGGLPYNSGYCCNNVQRGTACNTPVACENPGHCYYLSPSGNDETGTGSLNNPWLTFDKADDILRKGDYLYIKGGTYNTVKTFVATATSHGGTGPDNKVIVKAYGDSPATFLTSVQVFYINNGANWFTIDGLFNDEIYLIFRATDIAELIRIGSKDDDPNPHLTNHVTVRGIELDGSRVNVHRNGSGPFIVHFGDYFTLENSYIHNFWLPTGSYPPGDGSAEEQGGPSCVWIGSSDFFLIKNNIVERCNFGGIIVSPAVYWVPKPGGGGDVIYSDYRSKYGKIINNFVDVRYGGGIYLDPADYSLVEGNVETHAGETTTHQKPGVIVSGNHNTVRNNIIYNPNGADPNGWGLEMHGWTHPSSLEVDGNMINNNVMFGNNIGSGIILWAGNDASKIENNWFFNNIIYHNPCEKSTLYCPTNHNFDLVLDYGHSDSDHDCSTGTTWDPRTTHFCGNKFYNNLIRDESTPPGDDGMNNNQIIFMWVPMDVGSPDRMTWGLSGTDPLTNIHLYDDTAFKNNIGGDPLLVSEDPDTHGLNSDWWHIRPGSPAINKGVAIPDTNGEYVENLYPGYGWGNLSYKGCFPDIGAQETDDTTLNCPVNTSAANTNSNTNISVPVD